MILGRYSVAELQDLIAAKDATIRNLARRFEEVKDLPQDFSMFLPAFQALTDRYNTARTTAEQAIEDGVNSLRPTNLISANDEYENVLTSLNSRWKETTWAPGDGSIDDLYDQIDTMGATGKNDEAIPQPTQGSDADFNALTAANQATSAISSAGANLFDTKHIIIYGIAGGAFLFFVLPKLVAVSINPALLLKR